MEEHEKKNETITLKKSSLWKISTFVLFILLIISIYTGGFGYGDDVGNIKVPNNVPTNEEQTQIDSVSLDDDAVLGNKNAPVTIVEFSDYQCPFCRRSYTQVFPLLKENFINTGKVKFIFRDFPLSSIHPGAVIASQAAECADDEGKYWEMHDKMFDEQNKLGTGTVPITLDDLKKWANELGLDIIKFNSCLDTQKYLKEVEKDFTDGASYGVQGTPAYFIGNDKEGYKIISGAQPYQVFEQAINSLL